MTALFLTAGVGAYAQDAPHIIYSKPADSEFCLIDPVSAAMVTGADQVAREDTYHHADPQISAQVIYFHKKPKHKK